jgi:hypothetical protein
MLILFVEVPSRRRGFRHDKGLLEILSQGASSKTHSFHCTVLGKMILGTQKCRLGQRAIAGATWWFPNKKDEIDNN